jgi:Lon protease-like protein
MSGESATPAAALEALPLFPLSTVLFPDGSLSLQIFEVRYLDLIGKCYKNGTPFGVVSLLQGREVRQRDPAQPTGDGFANEVFADVGTLAHIVEFAAPQAGLMVIRCSGGARFHIRERRQLKHGLWVADVDLLGADVPSPIPQDLQPFAHGLAHLVEQQAQEDGLAAPLLNRPYRFDDCGWVANRWCDLLAIPASTKQGLMQLDSPLLRLELVGDLLLKKSQP